MVFNNFNDIVQYFNQELKDFTWDFINERKLVAKLGRRPKNILFAYDVSKNRNWAINEGGGIEIQYHIGIDPDNEIVYYGLGFNTQYVQFANAKSMVEYAKPFMIGFISNQKQIKNILPDYHFVIGNESHLKEPKHDQYTLFGKEFRYTSIGNRVELDDLILTSIKEDLIKQFEVYKLIFNAVNNSEKMILDIINKKILLEYKKQIILQGPPGTGKTRLAKEISKELIGLTELKDSDQLKLIQFHPSYTYEDFVRGIVSKPNEEGDGIIYEAENKILAEFAKKALDNYLDSKKDVRKSESKNVFDAFIESVKDDLAQSENHKYSITDAVYLFSADETRFKYKGDNWVAHNKGLNMKFSELKKIIDAGVIERQEIKKLTELEELTRQHATYFLKLVEKYYDFKRLYKVENSNNVKIELKNYVLIIDEINRANLSSVLGELIYALEYRGESVESMYEVEGENKLILPPNLYIIGTMNTADRSVGHIDYAIRRRFAFVDVLPKDLSSEEGINFDSKLFHQVVKLFETNLSPEFEKKDVQLGHSYFIQKKEVDENRNEILIPNDFNIRLEYEIKPILLEYVKDGVLIGEDINQKIEDLEVSI